MSEAIVIVLTPEPSAGYVVTSPSFPGLTTEGDTLEQALAMATDAIQGYLVSQQKDDR